MNAQQEEYRLAVMKTFFYFILELITGGILTMVGMYFQNDLVIGMGIVISILGFLLFAIGNRKIEKEKEHNEC